MLDLWPAIDLKKSRSMKRGSEERKSPKVSPFVEAMKEQREQLIEQLQFAITDSWGGAYIIWCLYCGLYRLFFKQIPKLVINGVLLSGLFLFGMLLQKPDIVAKWTVMLLKAVPQALYAYLTALANEIGAELWSSVSPFGACKHLPFGTAAAQTAHFVEPETVPKEHYYYYQQGPPPPTDTTQLGPLQTLMIFVGGLGVHTYLGA